VSTRLNRGPATHRPRHGNANFRYASREGIGGGCPIVPDDSFSDDVILFFKETNGFSFIEGITLELEVEDRNDEANAPLKLTWNEMIQQRKKVFMIVANTVAQRITWTEKKNYNNNKCERHLPRLRCMCLAPGIELWYVPPYCGLMVGWWYHGKCCACAWYG
jgi:hypothetical protein